MAQSSVVVKPKVVEEVIPFDPWTPVLKNSPSLHTTEEQELYIREVLEICCSDSAFAKKCYTALQHILTGAPAPPPVLSSLSPTSGVTLVPVTVVLTGSGFTSESVIRASGVTHPAIFVSATEISFSPDVSVVGTQDIYVENVDMQVSESLNFEVTPAVILFSPPSKSVEKDDSVKEKK